MVSGLAQVSLHIRQQVQLYVHAYINHTPSDSSCKDGGRFDHAQVYGHSCDAPPSQNTLRHMLDATDIWLHRVWSRVVTRLCRGNQVDSSELLRSVYAVPEHGSAEGLNTYEMVMATMPVGSLVAQTSKSRMCLLWLSLSHMTPRQSFC